MWPTTKLSSRRNWIDEGAQSELEIAGFRGEDSRSVEAVGRVPRTPPIFVAKLPRTGGRQRRHAGSLGSAWHRGLRLRPARADDIRLLWEWANDPEVRAASFCSAPIPWETHIAWFEQKFHQNKSILLIAENEDGTPFGQIRFDFMAHREADLNISLAKQKRGMGLAVPIIRRALGDLFASTDCDRVHAYVKPENIPSMRVFEKAGFVRIGMEQSATIPLHFGLTRSAIEFACHRKSKSENEPSGRAIRYTSIAEARQIIIRISSRR